MSQSHNKSGWVLRIAAAGVILAMGTILIFPLVWGQRSAATGNETNDQRGDRGGTKSLISVSAGDSRTAGATALHDGRTAVPLPTHSQEPKSDSFASDQSANDGTRTHNLSSKESVSPPSEGSDLGSREQNLHPWIAPLLKPGENTTAFENITPNVREIRRNLQVNQQIGRFQSGLTALDQLVTCAGELQKRVDLLARLWPFADEVRSGPAGPLWEHLSSRPAIDLDRVDRSKQDFRAAVDRLKEVQESGFRKLNDPRLDARTELKWVDDTLVWAQKQTDTLHICQRDLDRVEFTVWTHARELPASVEASVTTQPDPGQMAPNLDVANHLEMIGTVQTRLDALRQETMEFLRSFPKIDAKVQAFVSEGNYQNDPVVAQWAQVSLVSGKFLHEFHVREAALDASERAMLADSHYTPSIVMAPVVEANQWVKKATTQTQERRYMVNNILKSIGAAPLRDSGGSSRDQADGRPLESDGDLIASIAARRKLFARHSYAITFDRQANRFNWAMMDILEPYVSYEHWWRWASDAAWYRGSDVRLDPGKFPKDAPATRKLWREFRSMVDAEGRLDAKAIKVVLQHRADVLIGDSPNEELPAEKVEQYWATFFLPDTLLKEVEYRRPPTPDAEVARLLTQVSEPGRVDAYLLLPWPPDPYVMPRMWRGSDDPAHQDP